MANQEREQLWVERIAQWRDSGLSQQAFAQQHGFPIRQVGYWVRRLSRSEPSVAAMVPVVIKRSVTARALVLRSPHNWSIEIPAGATASWLADLLRGCDAAAGNDTLAGHAAGGHSRRRGPPVAACAAGAGPCAIRRYGLRVQ